mgnify:FL=1
MRDNLPDVTKIDVSFFDMVRSRLKAGTMQLLTRHRLFKLNFWAGKMEISETITHGEVPNAPRQ